MVCVICYESVFKAAAAGTEGQPAALGCGHTFHSGCIVDWFRTSGRHDCPMCHKAHAGQPLALFVELDDDAGGSGSGGKKKRGRRGGKAKKPEGGSRGSGYRDAARDEVQDLYETLGALSLTGDPELAFMSAYGSAMFAQEELEDANDEIDALQAEVAELRAKLAAGAGRGRVAQLERDKAALEQDVARLTRHSGAQRAQIDALQAAAADKRALEIEVEELRADIRNVGYLEREVARLSRLSDAHRSHITSLQRNLEDKKDLIYDYECRYGRLWCA